MLAAETINWWANILEGSGGAFVGVLGAFAIAYWIFRRENKAARALALEERKLATASTIYQLLQKIDEQISALANRPGGVAAQVLESMRLETALVHIHTMARVFPRVANEVTSVMQEVLTTRGKLGEPMSLERSHYLMREVKGDLEIVSLHIALAMSAVIEEMIELHVDNR